MTELRRQTAPLSMDERREAARQAVEVTALPHVARVAGLTVSELRSFLGREPASETGGDVARTSYAPPRWYYETEEGSGDAERVERRFPLDRMFGGGG